MIFGPNFSKAWIAIGLTLPISMLVFGVGFWAASRLVGAERSWGRVTGAVAVQWGLVPPIQLILGWLLSIGYADAAELVWVGNIAIPGARGNCKMLALPAVE